MPSKKNFVPAMLSPVEGYSLEQALAIGVAPEACKAFGTGGDTVILCTKDGRNRNVYGKTYAQLASTSIKDVIGVISLSDSLFAVLNVREVSENACEITGFRIKKINDSLLERLQEIGGKILNSAKIVDVDKGLYTPASGVQTVLALDGKGGLNRLMSGEITPNSGTFVEIL